MTDDRLSFDESERALRKIAGSLRAGLVGDPDPVTETRHLAAMRAAARETNTGPLARWALPMFVPKRRLMAGALAGLFGFTFGLGAAGALPGPAQDFTADLASAVGLDLPSSDDDDGDAPGDNRDDAGLAGDDNPNNDHGEAVSDLSRDEALEGCEKGQAVSDLAQSGGDDTGGDEGDDGEAGEGDDHDPCAQADGGDSPDSVPGSPESVPGAPDVVRGPPGSVPDGDDDGDGGDGGSDTGAPEGVPGPPDGGPESQGDAGPPDDAGSQRQGQGQGQGQGDDD